MSSYKPAPIEITNEHHVDFVEAKFTWKIHNFEGWYESAKAQNEMDEGDKPIKLKSKYFSVNVEGKDGGKVGSALNFFLSIALKDFSGQTGKFMYVYLHLLPEVAKAVSYSITVGHARQSVTHGTLTHVFKPNTQMTGKGRGFFSKEDFRAQKKSILVDGTLTVTCDLKIMCNTSFAPTSTSHRSDLDRLGELLLKDEETSDAVLKCQDQVCPKGEGNSKNTRHWSNGDFRSDVSFIKCHKLVLKKRSDVFAAMFRHNGTKENQTDVVEIEDINTKIMQNFVAFLYTTRCDVLDGVNVKDLGELLMAADKYNVEALKARCEDRLAEIVDMENVLEIIKISQKFSCEELENHAIKMVACHFDEALRSNWWPEASEDVVKKIVISRRDLLK